MIYGYKDNTDVFFLSNAPLDTVSESLIVTWQHELSFCYASTDTHTHRWMFMSGEVHYMGISQGQAKFHKWARKLVS